MECPFLQKLNFGICVNDSWLVDCLISFNKDFEVGVYLGDGFTFEEYRRLRHPEFIRLVCGKIICFHLSAALTAHYCVVCKRNRFGVKLVHHSPLEASVSRDFAFVFVEEPFVEVVNCKPVRLKCYRAVFIPFEKQCP